DYRRYEIRQPDEIRQLNIQTHNTTNYVTVDNFIVNRSVDPHWVEQESGHRIDVVPATRVIAKPELVVPVNTGAKIAVTTHQDIPTGTGKPNSAPPPNPAALNAPAPKVTASVPPASANALDNTTGTKGYASPPGKPPEQGPNAPFSNGPAASTPLPQQQQL